MDLASAFQTIGISLGLGLLVGFQRERVNAPLAGVRTFALITLFGTLTGMIGLATGPWVVVAGLVSVAITIVIGNLPQLRQSNADPGITTEIAILIMYALGVYLVYGHRALAVVLGAGVAVLLYAKPVMHGFVKRLGETDVRVIMQFVLISMVILPVLPSRPYGPFDAFNPREIWWMVVLVVAISLAAYVAFKIVGKRKGIVLGGIMGGLISSTATTASYSRHAGTDRAGVDAATLAVMLASTILYVRVLVEMSVVTGQAVLGLGAPIAVLLVVSIALCAFVWWRHRNLEAEMPALENPTELKSALVFGALYAIVQVAVAAAHSSFGARGVLVAAGISGLTDMDAITLSTSRLAVQGALDAGTAWRAITVAAIANLVFKAGIVAVLGGARMFRAIAMLFAIQIAAAITILVFWPG